MVRNAATWGAPVPFGLGAVRTGGRIGGAGWSAMGKATGLGVKPEFTIRAAIVTRVRGIGRAATLVLIPRVAIVASRGRFILRRRGSREAAGLLVGPVPLFSERRRAALARRRTGVGRGRVLGSTTALAVIPKFVGLAHRVGSHHRRSDECKKSKGGDNAGKAKHGKRMEGERERLVTGAIQRGKK